MSRFIVGIYRNLLEVILRNVSGILRFQEPTPLVFPAIAPFILNDITLANEDGENALSIGIDNLTRVDGVRLIPAGQDEPPNPQEWEHVWHLDGNFKSNLASVRTDDLFLDGINDIRTTENGQDAVGFTTASGTQLLEYWITHVPTQTTFYRYIWVNYDIAELQPINLGFNHPNNYDIFPENTYNPTGLPIPTQNEVAFQDIYPTSYLPFENSDITFEVLPNVNVDIYPSNSTNPVDIITTTQTNPAGVFTVVLPEGDYQAIPLASDPQLDGTVLDSLSPLPFTVDGGDLSNVHFYYNVAPPTNLVVSSINSTTGNNTVTITLNWTAAQGINLYRIRYRLNDGFYLVTTSSTNSLTLTDVSEGSYDFEVMSLLDNIESSRISELDIILENDAVPDSVPNFAYTLNTGDDSLDFTYDFANNSDNYTFEYKLSSDSTWITINDIDALTLNLTGLISETYDFRIKGVNDTSGGEIDGPYTTLLNQVISFVSIPAPPTNLNATRINSVTLANTSDVNITGTGSTGATFYRLAFRDGASTAAPTVITPDQATPDFTLIEQLDGTYDYFMAAGNSAGLSAFVELPDIIIAFETVAIDYGYERLWLIDSANPNFEDPNGDYPLDVIAPPTLNADFGVTVATSGARMNSDVDFNGDSLTVFGVIREPDITQRRGPSGGGADDYWGIFESNGSMILRTYGSSTLTTAKAGVREANVWKLVVITFKGESSVGAGDQHQRMYMRDSNGVIQFAETTNVMPSTSTNKINWVGNFISYNRSFDLALWGIDLTVTDPTSFATLESDLQSNYLTAKGITL